MSGIITSRLKMYIFKIQKRGSAMLHFDVYFFIHPMCPNDFGDLLAFHLSKMASTTTGWKTFGADIQVPHRMHC